MNDSLYNPDAMSKRDIQASFVARQPLLGELLSTIEHQQPTGAGIQHILIIAPRGMGKTTMLLMLQFAVEDSQKLSKNWQAIRFPEESYGVTELADLWIKVLQHLADATSDNRITAKIKEIESKFVKSEDLREAAWGLIKNWSKQHKKRLILLIDNFDMILQQIGSLTEQARLRDLLMNDGTVMLVGCAPSYFSEITDYEQPLYNFFKIYNLSDLKFADIEELLRRRAELDEVDNIEELLQKNRTRIKALEAFTGGNPRLVLMLYRIIVSSDMTEVRTGLEKLLDAVTPYYKDKTEKLPPQQRKVIDQIAQYSLEKREGISPTEIAERIRMTPNQVSSQLKRLAENGYVRALNIRGRSSFYVLSEPLYAIWAQMRFGRNAREKRGWLVQILKALFDVQEIQKEIEKLDLRVKALKRDGRENKVRGTLEYLLCLIETDSSLMEKNLHLAIEGYLELQEMTSLQTEITTEKLSKLPHETIEKLIKQKIVSEDEVLPALQKTSAQLIDQMNQSIIEVVEKLGAAESVSVLEEFSKVLEQTTGVETNRFIKLNLVFLYKTKFNVFMALEEYDKAFAENDKAIKLMEELPEAPVILEQKQALYRRKVGDLLIREQFEEASKILEKVITIEKQLKPTEWFVSVAVTLIALREVFNEKTANRMIEILGLEEQLFPLLCAMEYLVTKDETLIEKLSPEVRLVVEETIQTLQTLSEKSFNFETLE